MCLSQRSMQLSFKALHFNRFLPNPCTCVFISNSVCALLSVKLTVQIICFRPHKTWICLLYQLNRFLSNFPSLENNAINQNYIATYEDINLLWYELCPACPAANLQCSLGYTSFASPLRPTLFPFPTLLINSRAVASGIWLHDPLHILECNRFHAP